MHRQYNKVVIYIIMACCIFCIHSTIAQTICLNPATNNCMMVVPGGTSQFIQTPSPNNVDFVFDNLSKYVSGITYSGSTVLKLKIDANNVNCQWRLVMYVDNNGAPANEWETVQTYGSAGDKPEVDLIQVRIYNSCRTPQQNGVYQFFPNMATSLDIINAATLNASGLCNGTEVNSAGSYMNNYGEYSFIVDYRIIPAFNLNLKPGSYQIQIKFCLVEE